MGFFDDLFGGGQQSAYRDEQDSLRQAMAAQREQEARAEQSISPYEQAGRQALGQEQQFLGGMADPQAYINKILGGYKQSPGAQFETQQGIQAANRGAAASGMLGSGAEQKALTEFGQQVSSRDMQNYLNNILGVGREYLGGEQGLGAQGFRGAEDIGGYRMGLGRQLGQGYGALGRARMGEDLSRGGMVGRLAGGALGLASGFPWGLGSGGGSGGDDQNIGGFMLG